MAGQPPRRTEVRLVVIVSVELNEPTFLEALAAAGGKPVAEIVAAEVVSNLESVPYVSFAVASPL